MAVSGKTAAPNEIPYYLGTDKPPDMAAVTKAMADRLALLLPIRGRIENDGTIAAGSGFTAEKKSTGIYKITFNTEMPTACVPVVGALGTAFLVTAVSPGKKSFEVVVNSRATGALENLPFSFIAMPS